MLETPQGQEQQSAGRRPGAEEKGNEGRNRTPARQGLENENEGQREKQGGGQERGRAQGGGQAARGGQGRGGQGARESFFEELTGAHGRERFQRALRVAIPVAAVVAGAALVTVALSVWSAKRSTPMARVKRSLRNFAPLDRARHLWSEIADSDTVEKSREALEEAAAGPIARLRRMLSSRCG